ncbi:hypothetical protein [Pseudochelatococcus sp. G4_1912]|uniref:hypothetical protein n=1 Tax=Pseudochelatococcus sp. G4_1912 TaxID=3114288 RepID=UPI0039C649DB
MLPFRAVQMVGAGVFVVCALMLGGCLSSAEIARMNAENDRNRCEGYGFKAGSEAFAKCRFDLDQRRDEEQNAMMAAPIGPPVVYMPPPGPCWNTPWGMRCDAW